MNELGILVHKKGVRSIWGISELQRETWMSKPQEAQESWAALVTPEGGVHGRVRTKTGSASSSYRTSPTTLAVHVHMCAWVRACVGTLEG